jgi:hypothetical protein
MSDCCEPGCSAEVLCAVHEEARKHHRIEVQGGTWDTCCPVCKTHVTPHFLCVLDSEYRGPLPEGHTYEPGYPKN